MNCPSCAKEVVADKLFCVWCESFIPESRSGKKAGLFARWFACAIDPLCALLIAGICWVVIGGTIGRSSGSAALFILGIGYFAHIALNLVLLSKGMTVGKWLLGLQVVNKFNGGNPGIFKMLVREIVGKCISALFLLLGFFWAIWDKDSQAWHDKIAGTVVVKRYPKGTFQGATLPTSQPIRQQEESQLNSVSTERYEIKGEDNSSTSARTPIIAQSIQNPQTTSQPKQQNNVLTIAITCVIIALIVASSTLYFKMHPNNSTSINSRSSEARQYNNSNNNILEDHPEASAGLLDNNYIQSKTKYELKIIRNEIFARHGYIFKTADMKKYFSNKSWYVPKHINVTNMLSNVEKRNVEVLKRHE